MIDFGYMKVEWFASIEDEEFDWGLPGLNIVQAENGSGKSKFINALVWCIFGKTLSGSVEPWSHIRSSSYKGTKVSQVIFIDNNEIKITRYNNYSKYKNSLILEINDEEFDGGKVETQNKIEQLIGYTYDLFINSIIFGQKLKRLISETGPNKKKVLDEAFEVAFIPKAKKLAETKLKGYRPEFLKQLGKVDLIEEKVNSKKVSIEVQKQMTENFEADKRTDINRKKELLKPQKVKLGELKKKHPTIEQDIKAYNDDLEILVRDSYSDKEILEMERKQINWESQKDRHQKDARDFQESINKTKEDIKKVPDVCSECQKPFTYEEKQKEKLKLQIWVKTLEKNYQEEIETIDKLKGHIKGIEESISSAIKTKESIEHNKSKLRELEIVMEAISRLKAWINEQKEDIKRIREKKQQSILEQLILELSGLETQHKKEKRNLRKIQRDVSTNEWLIKDPLSNAGLKAFIFNQMLDTINDRLSYYSTHVGIQVAFFMDMKSSNKNVETYVFKDGEPVPYEDLSGGEQQTVDVVSAFGIHDVVSDNKTCSLLVMDEVFESLDKNNIEIMVNLIQEKAEKKCLYLITHRTEFNPTNANIIDVDKINGITRILS